MCSTVYLTDMGYLWLMLASCGGCKLAVANVTLVRLMLKELWHTLAGCSRGKLVVLNVSYLCLIASCGW